MMTSVTLQEFRRRVAAREAVEGKEVILILNLGILALNLSTLAFYLSILGLYLGPIGRINGLKRLHSF